MPDFIVFEPYFWIAVMVIAIIVEASTLGLTSIWFAIAALVTWLLSFIAPFPVQVTVFIIISFVLLYFTRPVAVKYLKVGKEKTNASLLIGRIGTVIIEINPLESTGQVKVDGQIWSAKTINNEVIPEGANIEVLEIKGVKLIVKPVE